MTDRVPGDLVHRLQDEQTPCGPHCHQSALIDALIDDLKADRAAASIRHRAVMHELSAVKGGLADMQQLVSQLAVTTARTAQTAADADSTAAHTRLQLETRPSLRPANRRVPRWVYSLAAGIGAMLGTAVATYAATRR